jgi:hypothetical protein
MSAKCIDPTASLQNSGCISIHRGGLQALLPDGLSVIVDAPDAVQGDEFRLHLRIDLHYALLQTDDLVSQNPRPVTRRTSIDIFNRDFAKIILRIVEKAQEKGVAGSHIMTDSYILLVMSSSSNKDIHLCPASGAGIYIQISGLAFPACYPTRQAPFFRSG